MQHPTPREQAKARDVDKQFLLTYPNLADPVGEVLLENERVIVQRLVVGPRQWEGIHSHPGNQLCVHIKGGVWAGRLGGESSYSGSVREDGSVVWMGDSVPLSARHESGNTGDTLIDLVWVTLKQDEPALDVEHAPQRYPNIPLELLLENDRVIVQRVQIEPGEWEGIHSHPGNQIYIHIKGGVWSERRGGVQFDPSPIAETGSVGWMDAVELAEGHESGNTGDAIIDQVWVTLK
jgi:quercetin dioxygenase-like cupin family protein